jgi:hypothetical protein
MPVACQECGVELAADSPDLRLELTCDDELITYCAKCWEASTSWSQPSPRPTAGGD